MSQASQLTIRIVRLSNGLDLELPAYTTPGAAGMDLRAAVDERLELKPGQRLAVPTGLQMAVPVGYEAQIRPRSGLALKHGLAVLNAPGTVDPDYRGEVKVVLANLSRESFFIERGDRIAQMVVAPVARVTWEEDRQLPGTKRGGGGFGHTGT